mmetsp:Transcript_14916/g.22209  ORF Transcript_14916/g.22209 Transcript_14916/m.22209 type:complete len:255 (+) Transcript_14916:887-1651(+)
MCPSICDKIQHKVISELCYYFFLVLTHLYFIQKLFRDNSVVGSLASTFNTNHSRGSVSKKSRDREGRNLGTFWLFGQFQSFPFKGFHSSKCRSDHDSNSFRVFQYLGSIAQSSILQGLSCGGDGKMGESVIGLDVFGIGEMVLGVEHFVGHFAADGAGHVLRIESFDLIDTGFSIQTTLEEIVVSNSDATNDTQTSHYHSLAVIGRHIQLSGRGGSWCGILRSESNHVAKGEEENYRLCGEFHGGAILLVSAQV